MKGIHTVQRYFGGIKKYGDRMKIELQKEVSIIICMRSHISAEYRNEKISIFSSITDIMKNIFDLL